MPDRTRVILLIDDEQDFAFFVKRNIELQKGMRVVVAHNGSQGIRLARSVNPDVILLDILMPGMNGFEVLRQLKEDDKTISIPVIMLTALGDDESKIKAAGLYDDDFIVKPAEVALIRNRIENALCRAHRA